VKFFRIRPKMDSVRPYYRGASSRIENQLWSGEKPGRILWGGIKDRVSRTRRVFQRETVDWSATRAARGTADHNPGEGWRATSQKELKKKRWSIWGGRGGAGFPGLLLAIKRRGSGLPTGKERARRLSYEKKPHNRSRPGHRR